MANTSPRTLKRHLQAAGTSYGQFTDRLRFDAAYKLLADAKLSIKQVAFALGYSGTNNFPRSFRRMTDMTPGRLFSPLELRKRISWGAIDEGQRVDSELSAGIVQPSLRFLSISCDR